MSYNRLGLIGARGFCQEKEMSDDQKKTAIKEFNFKKGILVATLSGIMSACFAFALQAGKGINDASLAAGTNKIWTGLPALVVVLLGGFTTNFIWCVMLNIKNKTGYQYVASHAREEHARQSNANVGEFSRTEAVEMNDVVDLKIPVFEQLSFFPALAGTCWVLSFFILHDGRDTDGKIRFRLLDVAHGEHHHFQHDVGMDFARVERIEQKGAFCLTGGAITTLILSPQSSLASAPI